MIVLVNTTKTGPLVHLDRVKEHLRIVGDHDDFYLTALTHAAKELFETQTGRILVQPQGLPKDEPRAIEINELITIGMLLCIGQWYENREASTSLTLNEIPLGVSACWGSYRWYNVGGA